MALRAHPLADQQLLCAQRPLARDDHLPNSSLTLPATVEANITGVSVSRQRGTMPQSASRSRVIDHGQLAQDGWPARGAQVSQPLR
jgi:hypothetical protein